MNVERLILVVVKSTRFRSGGKAHTDREWCSMVSFVPDPSGSNV